MVSRYKLEFMSLQSCLCLSTVTTFLMLCVLKMKKISYFIFLGCVPSSPNFLSPWIEDCWIRRPKTDLAATLFLYYQKRPPMASNAGAVPKCLKLSNSKIKIKNEKKIIIIIFFFCNWYLVYNRKKKLLDFFFTLSYSSLSKRSGFTVHTLYCVHALSWIMTCL